jgi:hypothetical protein
MRNGTNIYVYHCYKVFSVFPPSITMANCEISGKGIRVVVSSKLIYVERVMQ